MQKYADYLEKIEIDSLWSGRRHVVWELDRKVNILSGINGVGKSTILNKVVKSVGVTGDIINHLLKGVHITASPADATHKV
jgi:putative ribosome biogenesis GTPase RsgA